MRRRPLGKTGLDVTELGLGTWGLSGDGYGPVPESEQDRVIDRARALGITLFETADSYAHGGMERKLGERLKDDKRARIVTKIGTDRDAIPPKKRFDPEYLRAAVERSGERLGRDAIDVVLLHNPSEVAMQKREATALLSELKQSGKVRAWGVSAGTLDVASAAIEQGAQVLSLAYNALNQRELEQLSDVIDEADVGLLAHSVLGYGLLCGHWAPSKSFSLGDHRAERWVGDDLRRRIRQLDAIRPLIGGDVLSLRGGALRFVLHNERISAALLGPRNTVQLDQLVREAGKGPPYLEDDKLTALENRLRDVGVEV